jgi:hypothetical protein
MDAAFAVPAWQNGRRGLTEAAVGIPLLSARPLPKFPQSRPDSFERAHTTATRRRARARYAAKIIGGKVDA